MANYAMYDPDGNLIDIVVWDGETSYDVSPNTLVLVEDDSPVFKHPAPEEIAQVTPLQMRRALRAAGMLDAIAALVDTLDDDAKDAWEYATYYARNDPLIVSGAQSLGMTDAQIDELFLTASQL